MSDRPVRTVTTNVRLNGYDLGGRGRSQGNSQQAGGEDGVQEELDLPPALAGSDHEGDSESDDEYGDSDEEWGTASNARAGVQRGPAVHERYGAGGGVAGGGGIGQQGGPPPQQVAAPVQLGGVLPNLQEINIQPLLVQQVVPPPPPLPPPDRGPHLGADDPQDNRDADNVLDGRVELGPWLDPVVPGPLHGPLQHDGDGWNQIDRLGVWECGLSSFRALEEVPTRFREKWAKVMSTILRRLQQAVTPEEEVRALKWFLIAPQAFLREPKRGGKKGQIFSALNARFDCVVRGDFGSILALLGSDKMTASHIRGRARREPEDDITAKSKLRKTVLSLLKRGQIGRAVRRICSNGIASMDDPEVQAALRAKYPVRGRNLPDWSQEPVPVHGHAGHEGFLAQAGSWSFSLLWWIAE